MTFDGFQFVDMKMPGQHYDSSNMASIRDITHDAESSYVINEYSAEEIKEKYGKRTETHNPS